MNYRTNRPRRGGAAEKSGGTTVLYVLMFVAASIIVIGMVIALEKRAQSRRLTREQRKASARAQAESYSEEYRTARGDAYYESRGLRPNPRPANPEPEPAVRPTPVVMRPEVDPKPPDTTPRFIGRKDWNRYHRLNCKYVSLMPEENRVYFTSAADAWEKSYIPCKICKPPVPQSDVPDTPEPMTARTEPKPIKPTEAPVDLPVTDVHIDFPYTLVDHEVIVEEGIIRVELTVEVNRPLQRANVLALARKLVAAETRKGKINSVSIFMRTKVESRSLLKWVCMVDWAPYGNLTRANEVKAGDYRTHKFSIFDQGFFRR